MTPREFIAIRAAHFSTAPNLDELISLAETRTSTSFGSLRYQAIALLVCHWLALNERDSDHSAVGGQITSEKTGGLSRSYGGSFFSGTTQSTLDADLAQTFWGLELQRLQQGCIVPVFMRPF